MLAALGLRPKAFVSAVRDAEFRTEGALGAMGALESYAAATGRKRVHRRAVARALYYATAS